MQVLVPEPCIQGKAFLQERDGLTIDTTLERQNLKVQLLEQIPEFVEAETVMKHVSIACQPLPLIFSELKKMDGGEAVVRMRKVVGEIDTMNEQTIRFKHAAAFVKDAFKSRSRNMFQDRE